MTAWLLAPPVWRGVFVCSGLSPGWLARVARTSAGSSGGRMDMSAKLFAEYADKVVEAADQARALRLVQIIYDEGLQAQMRKNAAALGKLERDLVECRTKLEEAERP